ncbi:MAG TPA: alpha-2-macroglobulin family protein, partial [Puia sp.]|nr:alpha-2-macroglobulin family protein [Puia sp.]
GRSDCNLLLHQVLEKNLELQVETVNMPNQPFRTLLTWRNFSTLYGRIVQVDHSVRTDLGNNTYDDSYWKKLLQLPVYRNFSRALPATGDYQTHRVEIGIDALPMGEYAIVTCSDSAFRIGKYTAEPLTVVYFHVSGICFINSDQDHFVLDRDGGQPLANAAVQVYESNYDRKKNQFVQTPAERYSTDEHGHFTLKERPYGGPSLSYDINSGSDRLFMAANEYYSYSIPRIGQDPAGQLQYELKHQITYFFTDRAIYRPGQTLFFKGIVLTRDGETHRFKILPQHKVKVYFRDANFAKADSLAITTNEFGSYHGQFRIPEHLLNGEFALLDSMNGQSTFSVEEYKRPSFLVGYDTLTTNYRIGDSVLVTGYTQAFAGNRIDGVQVKYRVVRNAPRYWGGWRPYLNAAVQELTHGVIRADNDGKFTIRFKATADKRIDKAAEPVFEYEIFADVTDINGETRSGSTTVRAGYQSLQLTIEEPQEDELSADSLKKLLVRANNLSGLPVFAVVQLTVYSLRSPDRLIRDSYWERPDVFLYSREEYLRSFPRDNYDDELNKQKWARTGKVLELTDSAGKQLLLAADIRKELRPGWYLIEAQTRDKDGEPLKSSRFIELYDGETGRPPVPQYSWPLTNEETVNPGDTAHIAIGTSTDHAFVIRKIDRLEEDGGVRSKTAQPFVFFTLNDGRKTTDFPVMEADRGGFGVADVFVRDGRVYSRTYTVHVPWSNKKLEIVYGSFRDKTIPGSKETWTLTVKGPQSNRATAEVLTGMYDVSLDQFQSQEWQTPPLYPSYLTRQVWNDGNCFSSEWTEQHALWENDLPRYRTQYDELLAVAGRRSPMGSFRLSNGRLITPSGRVRAMANAKFDVADEPVHAHLIQVPDLKNDPDGSKGLMMDKLSEGNEESKSPAPIPMQTVQTRTDFRETAFFFPDLRTDSAGNVSFSFTMPEALTQWKWMTLAHTRDLAFGYSEKTIVTQKQLMVQPNIPRFLREGDKINLSVKVINLTDSEMTGQMGLALTDPTTGETADGWFVNRQPNQYFTVPARGSGVVEFPLDIPFQYNRPLTYRIVAQAGNYSDGEEATLPVVSNRMLVTETLPLNMPGDGVRQFRFNKLLQSGSSETLNHHSLTVEFTANPAWYAVQALPYLMQYPHECAEQLFDRLYANALASKIVNSSPRIAQVFAKWRVADTAALLSNLEKNPELKSALLEETPWVLQGKTESQQKKNIALLFDMTRMSGELESAMGRLRELQAPDGGFAWFKGGPDDRYVTQYILTGIGHLQQLQALPAALGEKIKVMVADALPYVDGAIRMDYERELKRVKGSGAGGSAAGGMHGIGELAVQYLYMRSMFNDYGLPGDVFPAVFYYRKLARQEWVTESKYMQGMIALALFRTGDAQTGRNIIASLRQTAIHSEEQGMYWKGMEGGYYWYQAPIETESLLIEAFREINGDAGLDRELKTWLLRQKQTHSWATTKATADAVYALLLGGGDWLTAERSIDIKLGDKTIKWGPGSGEDGGGAGDGEAGTGYNKKIFDAPFINPSMGNVTVTMKTAGGGAGVAARAGGAAGARAGGSPSGAAGGSPAWGAVYWQYFDQLDRITPAGSGAVSGGTAGGGRAALRLVKRLFVQRNTDRGPVLDTIPDNGTLKVGDRVVVRIELRTDRNLEYVHLKDMRAACLEPVNVLSGYKWQGGLGYYETTKDVSTEFFFPEVGKGTYVFEYMLVAGQT